MHKLEEESSALLGEHSSVNEVDTGISLSLISME